MILMPIVYVRDMDESVAFYGRLGFEPQHRSDMWTELRAGDGAVLALHAGGPGPVELALVAEEPLEQIAQLAPVVRAIRDEPFGRSLVLEDPSGLHIQVNEHHR